MSFDSRLKTIIVGFARSAASIGLLSLALLLAGCPSKKDNPAAPNPPAPTNTFTTVPSATPTQTATSTPTITSSATPSKTPTPLPSPTPSDSPTVTATFTATQTAP